MKSSIAERIFDGRYAEVELDEQLTDAGVQFEDIGWDHYDDSIELNGVPADHRLSIEAQRLIHIAGFAKAYVNHVDKWETHYSFKPSEAFAESKGWRVSYPHKRGDGAEGIWVEECVPTWPSKWFDTGYVIIKPLADTAKAQLHRSVK